MINKEKISKEIKSLLEKHKTPSIQVAMIKDGEIILNEAYGYADIENKIKATSDTLYAIGSSTKAFTALAVAILVEEGKLEWDKPIKSYISWFKMYDLEVTDGLTVRDMLCHRCGLPRHDMAWYGRQLGYKEVVELLEHLEPSKPIRSTFQYQNFMFGLAGFLIESVTNKKWTEYIDEKILKPLGMSNSYFYVEDAIATERMARPYAVLNEEIVEDTYYKFQRDNTLGAAGSLNMNSSDALKWLQLNINKGIFDGNKIVGEKEIKECHKPQMLHNYSRGKLEGFVDMESYGFGWFIEMFRGHKIVHHGGSINGFSSMVGFIPELNSGFCLFANSYLSKAEDSLCYAMFDALLGNETIDMWDEKRSKTREEKKISEEKEIAEYISSFAKNTQIPFKLESYTGKYNNFAYGDARILLEEGVLYIENYIGKEALKHLCVNTFIANFEIIGEKMPLIIEFSSNKYGLITHANIGMEASLDNGIKYDKKSDK